MNKRGFSLIEILITLGLLTILGSVATVSYRGYMIDTEKTNLKNSGNRFALAVQNCISARGGWKIDRPDGTSITPCATIANLNFTCPHGADCSDELARPTTLASKFRYYCLSIKKTVSGKKLQAIVLIPYDNPSDYKVFCGKVSAFLPLAGKHCKFHHGMGKGSGIKKDLKQCYPETI